MKLTDNLIIKARNKGVDVKLDSNLVLRYKKSKFKTWSGKFIYSTRKELLSSMLCLAKNGHPCTPQFLNQTTAPTGAKDFKMYIVYQVVLSAEDGDYPQADFQTEVAAYNYIVINRPLFGDGQELYIKPISRGF